MLKFQLASPSHLPDSNDLLNVWSPMELAPVSFATNAMDLPSSSTELESSEVVQWAIELPSIAQGDFQLQQYEARLEDWQRGLQNVPDQIQVALSGEITPSFGAAPFSFDADSLQQLSPQEELAGNLILLRDPQFLSGGEMSFSPGFSLPVNANWAQLFREFREFTQVATQAITHFAQVNTSIAGHLRARTTVSWTGQFTTLGSSTLSLQEMELHQKGLAMTLRSRDLMARTITVVLQGVAEIAARLALPGGPILALPAVWRFIKRLLALRAAAIQPV